MTHRPRRSGWLLAATLTLAACGTGADATTTTSTAPSAEETTTTAAETTTSAPATTTTTAATTTTTVPATTTTEAPTTTLASFPPERESIQQGETVWAVVLAGAAAFDDPALEAAVQAANDAGYEFVGPTDCDVGAPEALGLPDTALTVSVYLNSEADANAAAAAFEARGVDGVVAQLQLFCLD
jgi:hypothetical protein